MKYLGIDYGTKRIGIAVSDDTGSVAFPLTTLVSGKDLLQDIAAIGKEHGTTHIVLGESRNFKDEPNPLMTAITALRSALEAENFTVMYELEFMTSAMAEREGETTKAHLDAAAAALILQTYLDRHKTHPDIE